MVSKRQNRGVKGNGTVFKRKDGRWEAKYSVTLPNGIKRTHCLYAKSQEDARRKLADAISKRDRGMVGYGVGLSLKKFYQIWLEEIAENYLKGTTIATYDRVAKICVLPLIGNKKLSKITVQDIQRCINSTKNHSVREAQQVKVVMSSIYGQAIKRQLVFFNPAKEAETPKTHSVEPDMWSNEQLKHFLEAAKDNSQYYLAYVLLATLGLRRGEVLGIRWKDINLENQCLEIRQQVTAVNNKPIISSLKTAGSSRDLPLIPQVSSMIKDLLDKTSIKNSTNLVFSTKNNTPISPRNFYRDFERLTRIANLPHIKMHTLRHMAACFMRDSGVDAKTCQTILGHSDVSTTLKIYQHSDMSHKFEAGTKIGNLILT